MELVKEYSKTGESKKLSFIFEEFDMGFFDNFMASQNSEIRSANCQRISRCSCDCNYCSWGIL